MRREVAYTYWCARSNRASHEEKGSSPFFMTPNLARLAIEEEKRKMVHVIGRQVSNQRVKTITFLDA